MTLLLTQQKKEELKSVERERHMVTSPKTFWSRWYMRKYTLRKNCYWIKSISFQKHVCHGFKSICYRISNIFIGLVVYFYELIACMLLKRNAFDSIAFFSQCRFMWKSLSELSSNLYFLRGFESEKTVLTKSSVCPVFMDTINLERIIGLDSNLAYVSRAQKMSSLLTSSIRPKLSKLEHFLYFWKNRKCNLGFWWCS